MKLIAHILCAFDSSYKKVAITSHEMPDVDLALALPKKLIEILRKNGITKDGRAVMEGSTGVSRDPESYEINNKNFKKDFERFLQEDNNELFIEQVPFPYERFRTGKKFKFGKFEIFFVTWSDTGEDVRYQGEYAEVKNIKFLSKADSIIMEKLDGYGENYEFPESIIEILNKLGYRSNTASSSKQAAFWKFKAVELYEAFKKWSEVTTTLKTLKKSPDDRFINSVEFSVEFPKAGKLIVSVKPEWGNYLRRDHSAPPTNRLNMDWDLNSTHELILE